MRSAPTLGSIFGNSARRSRNAPQPPPAQRPPPSAQRVREQARAEIERGFYDVRLIEIEVEEAASLPIGVIGGMDQGGGADIGEMLGGIPAEATKRRSA